MCSILQLFRSYKILDKTRIRIHDLLGYGSVKITGILPNPDQLPIKSCKLQKRLSSFFHLQKLSAIFSGNFFHLIFLKCPGIFFCMTQKLTKKSSALHWLWLPVPVYTQLCNGAGTIDPSPFLYNNTMYTMAGLVSTAAVLHFMVRPVHQKYFEKAQESRAPPLRQRWQLIMNNGGSNHFRHYLKGQSTRCQTCCISFSNTSGPLIHKLKYFRSLFFISQRYWHVQKTRAQWCH